MKTSVIIAGWNRVGKRVADAVSAQPDMMVHGVFEDDVRHAQVIQARGHRLLPSSPAACPGKNRVTVRCSQAVAPASGRTVLAPRVPASDSTPCFSALVSPALFRHHNQIKTATANTLAIARIAAALRCCGPIHRWHSTLIMPALGAPLVDGLDPMETDVLEDRELADELAGVIPETRLARVAVPYTHSHLHLAKIDFDGIVARGEVLESLESSPRIVVGHARDGWKNTADLQEFCRDLARPHGDRPEVFIWHESVHAEGRSLYLMMDVEPEAAPVPEMIDTIRLMANPVMPLSAAASITDHALQLGVLFKTPNPSKP